MNICDLMEIPYINVFRDDDAVSKLAVLNVHPSLDSLTQLIIDFANASDWRPSAILYESSLWLQRAAFIVDTNGFLNNSVSVFDLDYTTDNEFRPTLRDLRDSNITNIILDCSIESLPIILRQAMEVGVMTNAYSWAIINLDAHSLDLDVYRHSGVNITLFRILNTNHPIFDIPKPDSNAADAVANDDVFNADPETRKMASGSYCNANSDAYKLLPIYPEKFTSESIHEIASNFIQ